MRVQYSSLGQRSYSSEWICLPSVCEANRAGLQLPCAFYTTDSVTVLHQTYTFAIGSMECVVLSHRCMLKPCEGHVCMSCPLRGTYTQKKQHCCRCSTLSRTSCPRTLIAGRCLMLVQCLWPKVWDYLKGLCKLAERLIKGATDEATVHIVPARP